MASIHTVNPLEFCQTIMAGKTRECAFVVQYYSTAPSSVSWSLQRLIVDGILVRDLGGKWVHSGFFSGRQSNNWPFSQKHICITCCLLLYLVVPWQNWCDLGVDMFFFSQSRDVGSWSIRSMYWEYGRILHEYDGFDFQNNVYTRLLLSYADGSMSK